MALFKIFKGSGKLPDPSEDGSLYFETSSGKIYIDTNENNALKRICVNANHADTATRATNADSATKATQDGSGNVITSKYVTLDTAQTISGAKTFSNNTIINTSTGATGFYITRNGNASSESTKIYQDDSILYFNMVNDETTCGIKFNMSAQDIENSDGSNANSGTISLSLDKGITSITANNFLGNASTATQLQTARTINGTTFNGTGNITTANWGTSRTITIGATGKTINGSANVSWSHDEIGVMRYYDASSEMTSTEVVNTPSYIHTVSTSGGSIASATKPSGMDNAWGIIHLHTHTGNYATQLGFGGTTGKMYFRNAYNSASFGNWKTILDESLVGAAAYRGVTGASAVTHSGWGTNNTHVPDMSFIAYWNGAYSSSGASNLTYCKHGAFGTMATKSSGSYLALSGGTMTGTISSSKVTSTYLAGNQGNAIISSTASAGSYTMLAKMNSNNGYFTHGCYQAQYQLHYTAASTVAAGTNSYTYRVILLKEDGTSTFNKLYGAVWNDYAEFRACEQDFRPGQVVYENGDDTMSISNSRLQRGCSIVSDTYGFAIGETDEAKCPIAVSGRVLAYPYESREEFAQHIGWPVCSGPNGTVSIMTEEEEEKYPSRIIGTISAVPDYEEWGSGNAKVDGRVWIKIK